MNQETQIGKPGQSRPASSHFNSPRPPLRGSTKECSIQEKPSEGPAFRGLCRFSGASPVASALGIRSRRDPVADVFTLTRPCGADHQNRTFLLCWE